MSSREFVFTDIEDDEGEDCQTIKAILRIINFLIITCAVKLSSLTPYEY